MGHKLHHVWDEVKKVGRGFRILKEDLKFYLKFHKGRIDYKYDTTSFKELAKVKQVK